jgi:serine/threonine protein kinase
MANIRPDDIVAEHFKVQRTLGVGCFGTVLEARDLRTKAVVAIKMEHRDATHPQLLYEYRVMEELYAQPGIPKCLWFGYDDEYNILIMQRLNKSLEDMRLQNGSTLAMPFLIAIGKQALERLCTFHEAGFVHRDIKPENFMLSQKILYLIDFGLCKRVVDPESGEHIPHRTGKNLTGTPRYASIRTHRGHEQSRRDDLEAFMYMMIFLAKGSLPWQHSGKPKSIDEIGDHKMTLFPEDLCKDLPPQFCTTLLYAKNLAFNALPDYDYLLTLW